MWYRKPGASSGTSTVATTSETEEVLCVISSINASSKSCQVKKACHVLTCPKYVLLHIMLEGTALLAQFTRLHPPHWPGVCIVHDRSVKDSLNARAGSATSQKSDEQYTMHICILSGFSGNLQAYIDT